MAVSDQHSDARMSKVVQHYEKCLIADGGDSGQLVGWRNSSSQLARFGIIRQLVDGTSFNSVCDFGCGLGEYLNFLRDHKFLGTYVGVDASLEMVRRAQALHEADPNASFYQNSSPKSADLIVASGIFNVRLDQSNASWRTYVESTLSMMWECSSVGVVFNVLSTVSDLSKRNPNLFYMSPDELIQLGLRFSPEIRFAHHYGLFDSTIAIFRT